VRSGGFEPGAWVAAIMIVAAFYAPFAYLRNLAERSADSRPPRWGRWLLPLSILVFLVVAVAVAWLAPAWFGGVIIGGCIGVTIAFQVRRPRRPMPPSRPAAGPPSSDPPQD
jgi:O-antigen/teichoic acid export membrane protein